MKKRIMFVFLLVAAFAIVRQNVSATINETLFAEADDTVNFGYLPTQLDNGDFEHYPDKGETSATGGSDWQTTETSKQNLGYIGGKNGYFEWIPNRSKAIYGLNQANGAFIEMNNNHPAVLYQNLNTNPGDVILWKLNHAARNTVLAHEVEQNMEVMIGMNDPTKLPDGTNTNIETNLVTYTGEGITGQYGYIANISDLAGLNTSAKINNAWQGDNNQWKTAKAVYTIPENQTSTRFAFTSVSGMSSGNLLDDIVFETLLGNLKVDTTDPDNVIITGYWAPVEENENVHIKYYLKDKNSHEIVIDGIVDMSKLTEENKTGFIVKIPYNGMTNSDYELEISHEKYNTATITESFTIDDIETKNIVEDDKKDDSDNNNDNNKKDDSDSNTDNNKKDDSDSNTDNNKKDDSDNNNDNNKKDDSDNNNDNNKKEESINKEENVKNDTEVKEEEKPAVTEEKIENPKTLDNISYWVSLNALSVLVIILVVAFKKKLKL